MITYMWKANNFQITKVQSQGVAKLSLNFFCQFQPGIAYNSVAFEKSVYFVYNRKFWRKLAATSSVVYRIYIVDDV